MPRYMVRLRRTGAHGEKSIDSLGYELDEPFLAECPASLITPGSMELVQIVNSLMRAGKASAAIPADRLPGNILDALNLCQAESDRAEAAMNDAVFHA